MLLPPFAARLAEWRARRAGQPPENPVSPPFTPPAALVGRWEGSIHTEEEDVPFDLGFLESGGAWARVNGCELPVTDPAMTGDYLTGTIPATLPTADAARRPHYLALDLKPRGDRLTGAILAMTPEDQEGGAPGRRLGFTLAYWTELRRR